MQNCPHCQSTQIVKNGLTRHQKQNYRCKVCGKQFTENPSNTRISLETRKLIDRLLLEKISLAGIRRATKVGKTWLQAYVNQKLKQVPQKIDLPLKKGG
jgi:insertion element IS1 protein InsB